jgi:phosphate acetyltransferase
MSFITKIKAEASKNKKTILLTEISDERIRKAAEIANSEGFANAILLDKFEKKEEFAQDLYELRKHKGLTLESAKALIENPIYYANMMIKKGLADGLVCGAITSTANVLRPALQIIKTRAGSSLVSTCFFMELKDKTYAFADCALNINPNPEELANIAIDSAASFENLCGDKANVALLSYSTYDSGKGESVDKVREALEIAKNKKPDLNIDGPLQLDTAISSEVAALKAPLSAVAGKANVFVFPDINAANIGYKLVQRFADADACGPIMQGLAAPVNDLSRGASIDDIVGVIALTALQAAEN